MISRRIVVYLRRRRVQRRVRIVGRAPWVLVLEVGMRAGTEVRGIELVLIPHLEICGIPGKEKEIADAVVHESHAPEVWIRREG